MGLGVRMLEPRAVYARLFLFSSLAHVRGNIHLDMTCSGRAVSDSANGTTLLAFPTCKLSRKRPHASSRRPAASLSVLAASAATEAGRAAHPSHAILTSSCSPGHICVFLLCIASSLSPSWTSHT
ncbi:hypothetical protein DENSPDRAFT_408152 [Dentipellis sp. KUC8613]|nr:hypothetical protein DENSPDRAFT_408152 [Dentipellis sp. KUC8613]